jgi:hypothetical protein
MVEVVLVPVYNWVVFTAVVALEGFYRRVINDCITNCQSKLIVGFVNLIVGAVYIENFGFFHLRDDHVRVDTEQAIGFEEEVGEAPNAHQFFIAKQFNMARVDDQFVVAIQTTGVTVAKHDNSIMSFD